MQPFTEAVLNYFQQPPWTWPVSNLSNVLISSEVGNASPTPRSTAAVTAPSPALQRRLNVRVALSLISSRDKKVATVRLSGDSEILG